MRIRRIPLLIAVLCLCTTTVLADTYTWTGNAPGGADQDWSNAQNWSSSTGNPGVPGQSDTAIIGTSSKAIFTVNVVSTVTVDNLTVFSSTLKGVGGLTVNTAMECQNAQLAVGGGITIAGALTVDPVPNTFNFGTTTLSCPMTINGSGTINSNAILQFGTAVSLINNGTFYLDDGAQLSLYGISGASFVNNSLFYGANATCNTGSSVFSNAYSGQVVVNVGANLKFQGKLANSGSFFQYGNGQITITAAMINYDGADFNGSGTTILLGQTTVNGTATTESSLQIGNTVTINGTLDVRQGNLVWQQGTLQAPDTNSPGTVQIDSGANMLLNQVGSMSLQNIVLTNNGTVDCTNLGTVFFGYYARIDNRNKFYFDGDGEIASLTSGSPGYGFASFNNYKGLILKTSGQSNGVTVISIPVFGFRFYNNALYAKTQLTGGGTFSILGSGTNVSQIVLAGGVYSPADDNSEISGYVYLTGTASLNLNHVLTISAGGYLEQDAGTVIYGNGQLLIPGFQSIQSLSGTFNWNGGTLAITNPSAIMNTGIFNIQGGGTIRNIKATGVQNYGTINWVNDNNAGGILAGDGVVFYNAGQFNCQCDAGISDISSTVYPVFTNAETGVVTKSANTGTTSIGILFVDDSGRLACSKGTLELVVGYRDLGSSAPASVEELSLAGGTLKFDRPVDIHGKIDGYGTLAGTITNENEIDIYDESAMTMVGNMINNGKVSLDPSVFAYQGGGNFTQPASGRLVVPIRGTNATNMDFGQLKLDVNYGFVYLAGTLEVDITEGYAPPVGASFPFLTSAGRNGTFNNMILPQGMQLNYTPYGATLVVTGTVPVQIISPAIANGQFQFGFNTISNRNYTVQYKDNLATGTWTFLTNFTGDGSYWQAPPPLPLVPQRFFRVSNP